MVALRRTITEAVRTSNDPCRQPHRRHQQHPPVPQQQRALWRRHRRSNDPDPQSLLLMMTKSMLEHHHLLLCSLNNDASRLSLQVTHMTTSVNHVEAAIKKQTELFFERWGSSGAA